MYMCMYMHMYMHMYAALRKEMKDERLPDDGMKDERLPVSLSPTLTLTTSRMMTTSVGVVNERGFDWLCTCAITFEGPPTDQYNFKRTAYLVKILD